MRPVASRLTSLGICSTVFLAVNQIASAQNLQTFNVMTQYSASGANGTGTCSGQAGSKTLTSCAQQTYDFAVGEGIVIYGAGPVPATAAITSQPTVVKEGSGSGSHTYCYAVSTVDPLGGISLPSPSSCISGEPDPLSRSGTFNAMETSTSNVGPSPSFLWYVQEDSQPWQLVSVAGFNSIAEDVGQRPGTRGGWPNGMSSPDIHRNQNFYSYITGGSGTSVFINDALPTSFQQTVIGHDDTLAVQNAINAATAAGGGNIVFNSGTYNIKRPVFTTGDGTNTNTYSYNLSDDAFYSAYWNLYVPKTTVGHIHMQGSGSNTIINTGPDTGGTQQFILLGAGQSPFASPNIIQIQPVVKGATQLTLVNASSAASLPALTDILLYSGSYSGSACPNTNGTPGLCHFSELNTVSSINGSTVTLAHPVSIYIHNDGSSSFGLVTVPNALHDFSLTNATINTYNAILTPGAVYSLLIDTLTLNGAISHGPFGGGTKRDVTIQNSSWTFGTGDSQDIGYTATDEYDHFTNVSLLNNVITGYGAEGAEDIGHWPRVYATEGSSQFTVNGNTFNKASLFLDQTTDDVISNNKFNDGIITAGTSYGPSSQSYCYAPSQDASFVSFDSQASLDVDTNVITIDAGYIFPYLLRVGDFVSSTLTNNIIKYASARDLPAITSSAGTVSGNSFTSTGASTASFGVCLVADQSSVTSPTGFTVQSNTINATSVAAGVYFPSPGVSDPSPSFIKNNTYQTQNGPNVRIDSPSSINQSCPQ